LRGVERSRDPTVSVEIELIVGDPRLASAIAEAMLADADDRRFPFELRALEGGIWMKSARSLDPGDASAFLSSALTLLKAALLSVASVGP
jgi:hypothetical protein